MIRMAIAVFEIPRGLDAETVEEPFRGPCCEGEIDRIHALPLDSEVMDTLADLFERGNPDAATRRVLESLGDDSFGDPELMFVWDHLQDPLFGPVHVLYVVGAKGSMN